MEQQAGVMLVSYPILSISYPAPILFQAYPSPILLKSKRFRLGNCLGLMKIRLANFGGRTEFLRQSCAVEPNAMKQLAGVMLVSYPILSVSHPYPILPLSYPYPILLSYPIPSYPTPILLKSNCFRLENFGRWKTLNSNLVPGAAGF